jgi:hypothetical protein
MKRAALVLALATLSVPTAAGAMQTSSHPATPSKASASHVKIHGTVSAITRSTVRITGAAKSRTFTRGAVSLTGIRVGAQVEAEGFVRHGVLRLSAIHGDDRAAEHVSSAKSGDDQPGDDHGGQTVSATPSADDQPADDNGGKHTGQDDGPGHH